MNFAELQKELGQLISKKASSSTIKKNHPLDEETKLNSQSHSNSSYSTTPTNVASLINKPLSPSNGRKFKFPGLPPGKIPKQPVEIARFYAFPGRPPGPIPDSKLVSNRSADIKGNKFPGKPPGRSPASLLTKEGFNNFGSKQDYSTVEALSSAYPSTPLKAKVTGVPSQCKRSPAVSIKSTINITELPPIPNGPVPPTGLIARKLLWQNLPDSRTVGSIWERLIIEDAELPVASLPPPHQCPIMRSNESQHRGTSASSTTTSSSQTSSGSESPSRPQLIRLEPDFKEWFKVFLQSIHTYYCCISRLQKLINLFFEDVTRKKDSEKSDASRPGTAKIDPLETVLDPKRRQNLEICLKGLGLLDTLAPLLNTVVELLPFIEGMPNNYNPVNDNDNSRQQSYLSAENLHMLIGLYPTIEEEKLLNAHLQKVPAPTFAKAESFLIKLMSIKSFKAKSECCLIHLTFAEEASVCRKKAKSLCRCLTRVMKSLKDGALRSLLALTLRTGNYLNYGTKKGSTRGFSLDSLPQLKTVKSIDGSTNLLRFIAETIEQQNLHYWRDLRDSIGICQVVMEISFDDITVLIKQLQSKIHKVEAEIERLGHHNEEQKFINVFSQFIQSSKSELHYIQSIVQCIENKLIALLKLFAERSKTAKDGMEVIKRLARFWIDLHQAHLENHEKEQKAREQMVRVARRTAAGNQTARLSRTAPSTNNFHDQRRMPMTARPALSKTTEFYTTEHLKLTELQTGQLLSSQSTEVSTQLADNHLQQSLHSQHPSKHHTLVMPRCGNLLSVPPSNLLPSQKNHSPYITEKPKNQQIISSFQHDVHRKHEMQPDSNVVSNLLFTGRQKIMSLSEELKASSTECNATPVCITSPTKTYKPITVKSPRTTERSRILSSNKVLPDTYSSSMVKIPKLDITKVMTTQNTSQNSLKTSSTILPKSGRMVANNVCSSSHLELPQKRSIFTSRRNEKERPRPLCQTYPIFSSSDSSTSPFLNSSSSLNVSLPQNQSSPGSSNAVPSVEITKLRTGSMHLKEKALIDKTNISCEGSGLLELTAYDADSAAFFSDLKEFHYEEQQQCLSSLNVSTITNALGQATTRTPGRKHCHQPRLSVDNFAVEPPFTVKDHPIWTDRLQLRNSSLTSSAQHLGGETIHSMLLHPSRLRHPNYQQMQRPVESNNASSEISVATRLYDRNLLRHRLIKDDITDTSKMEDPSSYRHDYQECSRQFPQTDLMTSLLISTNPAVTSLPRRALSSSSDQRTDLKRKSYKLTKLFR